MNSYILIRACPYILISKTTSFLSDQPLSRDKKNSVQQNISNFLEHMRPEVVNMHLFQNGIIDDVTFKRIHDMEADRDKNIHIIFEVLFKRSNKEFEDFVSILEHNGMQFLAALLNSEFADAKRTQEGASAV